MEETVPIQTLAPDAELPSNGAIRAVVTLAWPFSSSTRQCALLLADPDFRLRTRKGQVRVRFTGPGAEAVAKSRIGIGDEITLHLGGATWAESKEGAIRTPGKSVDGELVFARQLELKVARGTGEANISLDAPPSPQKPTHDYTEAANSTPLPKAVRDLRSSWHESGVPIYSSPAFAKRIRLSADSFSSSAFDPFVDDQADTDEQASKKLRTSFGSVSQWRYAGRSPSPPKDTPGFDLQAELDRQDAEDRAQVQDAVMAQSGHDEGVPSQATKRDNVDTETETSPQEHAPPIPAAEPPQPLPNDGLTIGDLPNLQDQTSQLFTEMPPPPLPRSRTNELTQASNLARSQSPATPELRAVPNSGLPLPSPFPAEGSQTHYFEQRQGSDVPKVSSQLGEERTGDAIVEQQNSTADFSSVDASGTGAIEKGVSEPDSSSNGIAQLESQQGAVGNEPQKPLSSAAKSKTQREKVLRSELDPPVPPSPRPKVATPVKLPPNIFSLDGAGTTASNFNTPVKEPKPTPGSTPQSQRDKVMRQTFKSLFGIQTSPEPETGAQSPVPRHSEQQRLESVGSRLGGANDSDDLVSSTMGQAASEQATISAQAAPERREDPQTQEVDRDRISGSLPVPQVETQGEAKSSQDAERFAEKERQQSIPEQQGGDALQDQASVVFAQKREDADEVVHPAETMSKTPVVGQTFPASQPLSSTAAKILASQQEPQPSSAPAVIRLDSSSDVDPEDSAERDDKHQDSAPKAESPDTNATQQVDEGVKAATSASSKSAEMPKQSMLSGRFPRDRVIEDSQDELPTLLNTQASPTMDEDVVISSENKTQAPVLEEDKVEELQDLAEEEDADALEYQAERHIESTSVASDKEMEDVDAEPEDAHLREGSVADVEDAPMHDSALSTLDEQVHPPLTTEQTAAEPVDVRGGSENAGVKVNDVRRDDEAQPSQKSTQPGIIELSSSSPAPQSEPVSSVFDIEARPFEAPQELVTEEVEPDFGTQLRSEEPTQSAAAPNDRFTENVVEEFSADSNVLLNEASQLPSEPLAGVELKAFESGAASVQPQSAFTTQRTSQQLETQIPLTDLSEPAKENVADLNTAAADRRPSPMLETSQQSENQAPVTRAPGGMEEPVVRQVHVETSEVALSETQDADNMENSALLTPKQSQTKARDMSAADQSELQEREGVEKDEDDATADVQKIATSERQDAAGLETGLSTVTAGEESRTPASTMLRQPDQDLVQSANAQANMQTPIQSSKRKSTPRKSLSARLSHVPDVISAWFSPRRSPAKTDVLDSPSAAQQPKEDVLQRATQEESDKAVGDAAQASTVGKMPHLTHTKSNGILTSMGYYTPLSRLEEYLNPASQGTNTVEIIAVVSESTRKPERAKGGPKDYFTIFRTTEPSKSPASSVRVEVFRPWKAKLPVAEVGDVILLRGFIVKSRKRKPYLLSTDASGWCVWRYAEFMRSESHTDSLSSSSVREEVTGPPVELSEAERSHVRTLREWWLSTHPVEEGQGGEQGSDGPADGQTEHEGASGIPARL